MLKVWKNKMRESGLRWLWISASVFVLDQITKIWVESVLHLYESVAVLPVFNITLAYNKGAAFSFLAQAGGWQRWLFTAVAVIVSLVLIKWLKNLKPGQIWLGISLSLILGGALGNLYDRITLGHVVDFLDFYWNTYHFPAFNIADSAITVGACMLALDIFISAKKES